MKSSLCYFRTDYLYHHQETLLVLAKGDFYLCPFIRRTSDEFGLGSMSYHHHETLLVFATYQTCVNSLIKSSINSVRATSQTCPSSLLVFLSGEFALLDLSRAEFSLWSDISPRDTFSAKSGASRLISFAVFTAVVPTLSWSAATLLDLASDEFVPWLLPYWLPLSPPTVILAKEAAVIALTRSLVTKLVTNRKVTTKDICSYNTIPKSASRPPR